VALTKDIPIRSVGPKKIPVAAPLPSGVTVYSGSIALIDSSGLLKNAASPATTDTCIGLIGEPTGATPPKTGPGIVGAGSTQSTYNYIDCVTGTFLLASGKGADALTEATAGATVYVIDEQTVGKLSTGRPPAGVQSPIEPTTPTGFVPIKMNSFGGTGP